jgi:cysteine desulfurase
MKDRAYFDWNATAPLRPRARAAMVSALAQPGNPSSVHAEGRAARALIERAREQVAALVGASPKNVTFTSGGTEANMLALSPATGIAATTQLRDRLQISAIEHPSVRSGGRFASDRIEEIRVTDQGVVDLDDLRRRLSNGGRPLVSVMLANNETGVVQPISQIAQLVHQAGGVLHVDAVQAAGKIAVDINALGADLLSLSAHKIGGPHGIGALVRREESIKVRPLVTGGGQERGVRPGTENVAAIAGFGAAAETAKADFQANNSRMAALRQRLESRLVAMSPNAAIFSARADRLPNTTLVAVPGLKAETAVIAFDLEGIAVSSGSACSSGKVAASHVLAAMGVEPDLARAALRLSLGWETTESDLEQLLNAWNKLISSLAKGQTGIAA